MTATVQNTGDFPIIITGGYVNGMAAINATGQLTLETNSTAEVTLNYPARSLLNQMFQRNGVSSEIGDR